MSMSNKSIIQAESSAVLQTFSRFPVALAKGKGSYVWDVDGKKYLDFMTGIAVNALGHAHPALLKAGKEQLGQISHSSNLFYTQAQVSLAEQLKGMAPWAERVAFANSGSEANELCIKFARKHGQSKGRFEILCFHGAFHGRTYGSLSASGQAKLQKNLQPLLPGFKHVHFNDLEAAKRAVNRHTAAIWVEPIQGENGVIPGSEEFLVGLRRLCDRNDLLLIVDEIQTGLGRTGNDFCYQGFGEDFTPDLMSLAKSLGGGLPLSAVLVGQRAVSAIGLGEHGSTLGGNPVACAMGLAFLKELKSKKLADNAQKQGARFFAGLQALRLKHPSLLKEPRGRGLMLGLSMVIPSAPFAAECLKRGLLVNSTAETVLRFLPPLNVSAAQVDEALKILDAVFAAHTKAKKESQS